MCYACVLFQPQTKHDEVEAAESMIFWSHFCRKFHLVAVAVNRMLTWLNDYVNLPTSFTVGTQLRCERRRFLLASMSSGGIRPPWDVTSATGPPKSKRPPGSSDGYAGAHVAGGRNHACCMITMFQLKFPVEEKQYQSQLVHDGASPSTRIWHATGVNWYNRSV